MRPDHMGIALGCFDDPRFVRPVRTIWTEHQHDWIRFPEDLPALRRQLLAPKAARKQTFGMLAIGNFVF